MKMDNLLEKVMTKAEALIDDDSEMDQEDSLEEEDDKIEYIKRRKRTPKDYDNDAKPVDSTKRIIRLSVWSLALVLIIVQAIFFRWWTFATGPVTAVIAFFTANFCEDFKENARRNIVNIVIWALAIIAIIAQIILWKWWTILTGIITVAIAVLITLAASRVSDYFRGA